MHPRTSRLAPAGSWSVLACGVMLVNLVPAAGFASVRGDFNGDGYGDLAITASRGPQHYESVVVLYGSAAGLKADNPQEWVRGGGIQGDVFFGAALASGDFDGNGFADLAIGAIGENVSGVITAGAVKVLYGSPLGLLSSGSQLWSKASPGVVGQPGILEQFGIALTAGDFDSDGCADLAIGTRTVGGSVHVLYGSGSGLTASGSQLWSQASFGVADEPELYDGFGDSLASGDFDGDGWEDLAIGAPGENDRAGVVHVLYGSASGLLVLRTQPAQLWSQASPGVAGGPEPDDQFGTALSAADFNGDGRADLAIGAYGENDEEGVVHVLYGSGSGLRALGLGIQPAQLWSQDSSGVAGGTDPRDTFGADLMSGDFNGDGWADLVIGAFGENDGTGVAHVLYGSAAGLQVQGPAAQLWSQATPGVAGAPEEADLFSAALAAGDFDGDGFVDLAIAAPQDIVGEAWGVVHILYGSSGAIQAAGSQWLLFDNTIEFGRRMTSR
jgi:hypothetical protein